MALAQSKIYRALGGDMRLMDALCEHLAAEKPARAVMSWIETVAKSPDALPLTDQNITDFRQGYYAKWLRKRENLLAIRERAASASRIVSEATAKGASLTEAARAQAMSIVTDVLESFDPAALKAKLAEDPAGFFSLAKSITDSAGVESARASLAQRAKALEADLRLRDEQIAKMRQDRETVKNRLREQVSALGKLIKATPNGAGHAAKIQALLDTLEAL